MENHQINPLSKYFRQPKIYIRLPSSGMFYSPGSLEKTESGEYPVYAMTAKDEITIRTPDALLNGQAIVDVIQSCMPNIKNAWSIPSIDVDAILTAIRLASYGEKLELTVTVPEIEEQRTYDLDLRMVLDKLLDAAYDSQVTVNEDITIFTRPLTYKEFTQHAFKTLEEQKIFKIVNDDLLSDEEKIERFNISFSKLTNINVGVITQSIAKIAVPGTEVTDPAHIKEFIDNADKEFYNKVLDHVEKQKNKFVIAPIVVSTTDEDRAKGAPESFEVPINLDTANFFG